MKTIGILQPGYLPWVGFFEQMLRADIFVLYDDVQYDKHGWRNRNRVKGPQGPVWLTVPVRVKGLNKPAVREVLIDDSQPQWVKKHLGTVGQFYRKADFFGLYYPALQELLSKPWRWLLDLDLAVIRLLAQWLGVEREMILSSQLDLAQEDPTARLVEICQRLGADSFYEGASGRNYLDLEKFDQAGLRVEFQDYRCQPYPQLFGEFIPYLSAIDLIFNCGPDSKTHLPGLPADEHPVRQA